MKKFGLLGRKLGHSYSPRIHANFGDKRNSRHGSSGEAGNRADQFQLVRIRGSKPKDFSFYMLPVFIELVNVKWTLLEFSSLFTGYRPAAHLHGLCSLLNLPVVKYSNIFKRWHYGVS